MFKKKITLKNHRAKQIALGKKLSGERKDDVAKMETKFAALHEAIQVTNANLMLRLNDDGGGNAGSNEYQDRETQIQETVDMYGAGTDIGSDLVKRIINVCAALKIPNGLDIEGGDDNSPERKYIQDFINVNQLNEGVATELSREAEKQGQCLVRLLWDKSDNQVKIKYMSWLKYKYWVQPIGVGNLIPPYKTWWDEVNTDSEDPEVSSINIPAGDMQGEEMAFVAFNRIINNDETVEGSSTISNILSRLDDIGNDLIYWRKSNKLYAHPTPAVKIEDADEAESLHSKITSAGWTLGQMLVSSGDLKMVVPDNFYETIKEAILLNLQLISGATGLAVSWLGFPDLMSNRAVADSLGEPLEIVAANDITLWKSFYEQMFDNVITIRNNNLGSEGGTKLKTGIIKPRLKPMSDRIWQQLVKLWMPAAEKEIISRASFHDKIPGFDVSEEAVRMKEQTKVDDEREIKKAEAGVVAKAKAESKLSPNNRDDIDQPDTGSVRFNEEQG